MMKVNKRKELARLWENVKYDNYTQFHFTEVGATWCKYIESDFSERLTKSTLLKMRADLSMLMNYKMNTRFIDLMISKINRYVK